MADTKPKIAILGGTGDLGSGLAQQFSRVGYPVTIGSRSTAKAEQSAAALLQDVGVDVHGAANAEAAAGADIVIMTVPFESHAATLSSVRDEVKGKLLVDTTVPLMPPKVMRVQLPPGDSAAKQAQEFLGDEVHVVSAFQNIAAARLRGDRCSANCDVLVCGNDPESRETVIELAGAIGLTAWHGGPIENSVVAEALTSVLIFINKRYGLDGAGIRITGEKNGAEE